MKTKRQKSYTDYSYVTHNELRTILNLGAEGVDFVLAAGHVLATVIGAREKYILGHVRKAQEQIVNKQNERFLEISNKINSPSKRVQSGSRNMQSAAYT
jgi:hypothetical protein